MKIFFLIIIFAFITCSRSSSKIPYQQYVLDSETRISLVKLNNGEAKICLSEGESIYQTLITNTWQMPFIDTIVNDTILLVYDNFLWSQDIEDTSIVMNVPEWEQKVGPLTIKYIVHYHLKGEELSISNTMDSSFSYYFLFDSLSMDKKQWLLFYDSKCIASIPQNRLVCVQEGSIGYLLYGVSYDTSKRISTTTKYIPKSQKLIWEHWGQATVLH